MFMGALMPSLCSARRHVQRAGWFTCSNERLKRIDEMVRWTLLGNLFGVQSDCPGREKFQYGGDIVAIASKVLDVHMPGNWLDPGPLGCLGVGMPFAMAAKLARPEKRVMVIFGDGSFGLTGFEFDTAVRFNLPIIAIVGNDAAWRQMRKPQLAAFGEERSAKVKNVKEPLHFRLLRE